jgi:hypothetical protein
VPNLYSRMASKVSGAPISQYSSPDFQPWCAPIAQPQPFDVTQRPPNFPDTSIPPPLPDSKLNSYLNPLPKGKLVPIAELRKAVSAKKKPRISPVTKKHNVERSRERESKNFSDSSYSDDSGGERKKKRKPNYSERKRKASESASGRISDASGDEQKGSARSNSKPSPWRQNADSKKENGKSEIPEEDGPFGIDDSALADSMVDIPFEIEDAALTDIIIDENSSSDDGKGEGAERKETPTKTERERSKGREASTEGLPRRTSDDLRRNRSRGRNAADRKRKKMARCLLYRQQPRIGRNSFPASRRRSRSSSNDSVDLLKQAEDDLAKAKSVYEFATSIWQEQVRDKPSTLLQQSSPNLKKFQDMKHPLYGAMQEAYKKMKSCESDVEWYKSGRRSRRRSRSRGSPSRSSSRSKSRERPVLKKIWSKTKGCYVFSSSSRTPSKSPQRKVIPAENLTLPDPATYDKVMEQLSKGVSHDLADAEWKVIRTQLRGHNDLPFGQPTPGRPSGRPGSGRPLCIFCMF